MPQLEEDEWPKDEQPTTTEAEQELDGEPPGDPAQAEYPPPPPPEALPTKD
jgi:hypothetical protein